MPTTAAGYKAKFDALDVASDGFWSVALPDGRFIWLLADNLSPRYETYPPADLRGNAYVIQNGETFTMTRVPAPFTAGTPRALWPLCGWATENVLHVLCDAHVNPANTPEGLTLASYHLPSMATIDVRENAPVPPLPGRSEEYEGQGRAIWAAGVYDDGTDIWIYGVVDTGDPLNKQHHVARCSRNCLADTFKWEYEGAIPHTTSASSLGPYASGKMVVQPVVEHTQRWTASDPTFSDLQIDPILGLTTLPEPGLAYPWAYAAHAHPWLPALTSGKMLITVNVNDGPGVPAGPTQRYFPEFFEIDQ